MTKEELITKQQLEIEEYKALLKSNDQLQTEILVQFYGIGQTLNDNILRMDKAQLVWCVKVSEMVKQLKTSLD